LEDEQQHSSDHSESESDVSSREFGEFTVGAPLSIYLLSFLVQHIELPWRATFYDVPFQDLKASVIAHLPGLPPPTDASDNYAHFQIKDAHGKELCTILLRNLNRGINALARKISVELRISGALSPACRAVVHGLIKGVATDFGIAGTVRFQHTAEVEPQEEVPPKTIRFTMLFGLKNEDPSLTAIRLAEKYEQLTGEFISEDMILKEFKDNGVRWKRGKRAR
jgi:hypothetical protein